MGVLLFIILSALILILIGELILYLFYTIYGSDKYEHELGKRLKRLKPVFTILLLYLLGGFITLEWNPLLWKEDIRIFFSAAVIVILLTPYMFDK